MTLFALVMPGDIVFMTMANGVNLFGNSDDQKLVLWESKIQK